MTNTKPDLTPNERKVLDSLLALGGATAAKVGEHAGLAYPTTTPKLRKLETLGLAEKFRNEASQTLWRAANTEAAAGKDDSTDDAAQPTSSATDLPGHPGESGSAGADADDAAPNEGVEPGGAVEPEAVEPGGAVEPEAVEPGGAVEAEAVEAEVVEPEAVEAEESGNDHAPDGTTSTAAEPTTSGDDSPAAATPGDATAPADAPAPKAKRKRPAGALEASVLAILQGDPDSEYKVNDLRKLVDKADEATGYPAASAGAIANALDKLAGKGQVISVPERTHATFQAAPAG
jgi:hypothetical protein